MNFLASHIFQETLRPPFTPSPTYPLPLLPGENSVWCVLYVKSMVLGHWIWKPACCQNQFCVSQGVPCIIITPAQQLRLWIHNTKRGQVTVFQCCHADVWLEWNDWESGPGKTTWKAWYPSHETCIYCAEVKNHDPTSQPQDENTSVHWLNPHQRSYLRSHISINYPIS